MIIKKLHTPEGVKDYLPSECILKTKIVFFCIDGI